ncbi:hypothetical protein KEJ23_04370, partial [Candidatus Bathyarchaeota archaeon]|nr:hypothetical protein [Candidatus Bathyarchaeota archaeon]
HYLPNLNQLPPLCYWRIKFWDDKGNEGSWSSYNYFALKHDCVGGGGGTKHKIIVGSILID